MGGKICLPTSILKPRRLSFFSHILSFQKKKKDNLKRNWKWKHHSDIEKVIRGSKRCVERGLRVGLNPPVRHVQSPDVVVSQIVDWSLFGSLFAVYIYIQTYIHIYIYTLEIFQWKIKSTDHLRPSSFRWARIGGAIRTDGSRVSIKRRNWNSIGRNWISYIDLFDFCYIHSSMHFFSPFGFGVWTKTLLARPFQFPAVRFQLPSRLSDCSLCLCIFPFATSRIGVSISLYWRNKKK